MNLFKLVQRFYVEEDAATAVEYAVMLALIATVCMQAISLSGFEIRRWWDNVDTDMGNALNN